MDFFKKKKKGRMDYFMYVCRGLERNTPNMAKVHGRGAKCQVQPGQRNNKQHSTCLLPVFSGGVTQSFFIFELTRMGASTDQTLQVEPIRSM